MDIRVYLYNDYDPYAVKILKLLEKCDLKFTFNTYSRDNMDYNEYKPIDVKVDQKHKGHSTDILKTLEGEAMDEAAALEAKARAEEALADKTGKIDYARAQAELAEAVMQLRTLDRFRKRGS